MPTRLRLPAAAVVVVLAAGACGDAGPGLDRDEVIARGDRACGEAEDRIQAMPVPVDAAGEGPWRRGVAEVLDQLQHQLEALREEAPDGLAADLRPALDALDEQVDALRSDPDDAALARAEEAAVRAHDAFAEAGFEVCGRAT